MIEMRWKKINLGERAVYIKGPPDHAIAFDPHELSGDSDFRVLQYREKLDITTNMMLHKMDTVWSEWKDVEAHND